MLRLRCSSVSVKARAVYRLLLTAGGTELPTRSARPPARAYTSKASAMQEVERNFDQIKAVRRSSTIAPRVRDE